MGKWYKITGITDKLYEDWKDDLRSDIIVYNENDEWQFRMCLTWFEAICMRIRMIRTNLNNPCVLKLERDIRDYFTKEIESK